MTLEEIISYKNRMGYSNAWVSEQTGVPLGTVQKIFSGETKRPRYQTLQSLKKFFEEKAAEEPAADISASGRGIYEDNNSCTGGMVRDTVAAYAYRHNSDDKSSQTEEISEGAVAGAGTGMGTGTATEKRYTLTDYYNLPDDVRAELIDGQFFYMTAPRTVHQRVQGEIHRQIANYIFDNDGDCIPFMAPTDVQLDMDEYTMLEPDVFVICDPERLTEKCIWGAPDFVIEITSPSTRKRDFTKKLSKYEAAGVKEYWIVNLKDQNVVVYRFQEECCPVFYPMTGEIPVGIYDGNLKISFDRIGRWVTTGSLK